MAAAVIAGIGLAGPASAAGGTYYVALGDSYTSGYGLPTVLTSPSYIAGCGQSSHSYPHVIAAHYGIALDDRACAGAVTANFTTAQGSNPAQDSALGTSTRLVTIGMGGNDAASSYVTTTCLQAGANHTSCQTPTLLNAVSSALQTLANNLPGDIAHIKSLAPNATIVYVGYLSDLPNEATWASSGCSSDAPYYSGDINWLDSYGQRLDAVLKTAAQSEGAIFVDALALSAGHDTCKPESTRWDEGLYPVSPATAAFHPNLAGEAAYASMIEAAL